MERRSAAGVCAWGVAVAVLVTAARAQITVTVNPSQEYQTIEGFGAHGSMEVWWSSGPFYNAAFVELVVDNLGFTMHRNQFYPDYENTNDNGDPNTFGTFNQSGYFVTKQRAWINAVRDKAAASNEPVRFIASFWSPPPWMKVNGTLQGGDPTTNVLRTGLEAELAELGTAAVKAYKDYCNVDLYALSMQNEPAFDEPYESCVYTATRYRDVFKVFAARVKASYPNVKMFGAEDMLSRWTVSGAFPGPLMVDTTSRRLLDVMAVHGYSDGVHPTPVSQAAGMWRTAARNMATVGKPLWMTETSGYFDNWDDAFRVGEAIYVALRYGKISAWVWWQLCGSGTLNEYGMMSNGQPSKRAYVHKQYARYIRPDAVGVGDTVVGDTLVFSVAFRHKTQRTLAIVLLNANTSARTVTLAGPSMPSFAAYRTTGSEDCVAAGTVTTSVTLPASSIVTLYGQNYDPAVGTVLPAPGRRASAAHAGGREGRVFTLDGTMVRGVRGETTARGVRVAADGDGSVLRVGVRDR